MDENRQSRVKRLKYFIVLIFITLLVLPTVLCVILFCKLNNLEKQLELINKNERKSVEQSAREIYEGPNKQGEVMAALEEWRNLPENAAAKDKEELLDESAVSYELSSVQNEADDDLDEVEENEDKKKVYLTFDDGPGPNTERILDILDKYDIKATFFVVNCQSDEYKKYYKEIVDRGHSIGMHSYSHVYTDVYNSKESFVNDVAAIKSLIYEETGVKTDLYRFPGGSSNRVSRVPIPELIETLEAFGIEYYDWNVSSQDASAQYVTKETIESSAIGGVRAQSGDSMVLLHDLGNKNTTVEALPAIIETLLLDGNVEFEKVDENSERFHHPIG